MPPLLVGLQHDYEHLILAQALIDELAEKGIKSVGLEHDEWSRYSIEAIHKVMEESKTTPETRRHLGELLKLCESDPPIGFFATLKAHAEKKGMRVTLIDSIPVIKLINIHTWRYARDLMNNGMRFPLASVKAFTQAFSQMKAPFYEREEIRYMFANLRNRAMRQRVRNPPSLIIVGAAHAFELSKELNIPFREVAWLMNKELIWKPTTRDKLQKLNEINKLRGAEEEILRKLRRKRFEIKKMRRRPSH